MALAGKSTEQHSNIAPATIGPAGVSTAMPAFFGQGRVFTKGGGEVGDQIARHVGGSGGMLPQKILAIGACACIYYLCIISEHAVLFFIGLG